MQLQTIKDKITSLILAGTVSREVVELLLEEMEFIPSENSLWDYKESFDNSTIGYADLVKDIHSYYNSFGGYLVFGITEVEKDKTFVPCGIDPKLIEMDKLKGAIRSYIDHEIEIVYRNVTFEIKKDNFNFGLLYIPKRHKNVAPIFFKKNSPEKKGRSFFHQNETWYRRSHECVRAQRSEEFAFLWTGRDTLSFNAEVPSTELQIFQHNLPDKNLICSDFIGRDEILKKLWEWLSDDFEYSKVLAGDGGKGKTSIAYEFARQVLKVAPCGFKAILWLTAKEKQFYGFHNEFRPLPRTDYDNVESLLQQICLNLGFMDEEVVDVGLAKLKKLAREALSVTPSLVVVDDLDSTDPDEQKKLLETALQISNQNSRFLLTTRANLSYSSDLAITVPGLPIDDYKGFVSHFCARVKVSIPKNLNIEILRSATDGSPLLTESIIRLVCNGYSFDSAIKEWKGKAGRDARNFVLRKEIERLSPEAKRVLLVASILGDCSFTELKEVAQYENLTLSDAVAELKSLFLINSPSIIEEEQRFEIPKITASLVIENKNEICSDYGSIANRIKSFLSGKKNTSSKIYEVGKAISQGNALARSGDVASAIKTIDVLLETQKYKKNPDLLLAKGKYILEQSNPDLTTARNLFDKAHSYGLRKEILYLLWHRAESMARHHPGIIKVCSIAIDLRLPDEPRWLFKRAQGYSLAASCVNPLDAITYYKKAFIDLTVAIKTTKGADRQTFITLTHEIYDRMYALCRSLPKDVNESILDVSLFCTKNKDQRPLVFNRMIDSVLKMHEEAVEDRFISPARHEAKLRAANSFLTIIENEYSRVPERIKGSYFERVANRLEEAKSVLRSKSPTQ